MFAYSSGNTDRLTEAERLVAEAAALKVAVTGLRRKLGELACQIRKNARHEAARPCQAVVRLRGGAVIQVCEATEEEAEAEVERLLMIHRDARVEWVGPDPGRKNPQVHKSLSTPEDSAALVRGAMSAMREGPLTYYCWMQNQRKWMAGAEAAAAIGPFTFRRWAEDQRGRVSSAV
jgi:hypothetical protein